MNARQTFETYAVAACADTGLVGRALLASIIPAITTSLLMRRGLDIVRIEGHHGSGRTRLAHACHRAMRKAFGTPKSLHTNIDGIFDPATQGLLLDHPTAWNDEHRLRAYSHMDVFEQYTQETRPSAALCILIADTHTPHASIDARATATLTISPLHERSEDAADIAQHVAMETALQLQRHDFVGLTRQAQQDVVAAVSHAACANVRLLRHVIRDVMFERDIQGLLSDVLDSASLMPILEERLAYSLNKRQAHDLQSLRGPQSSTSELSAIAAQHDIPVEALSDLCEGMKGIIDGMDEPHRSYKNIVDRTQRMSKIALWLLSGAQTQAQFRRFFGNNDMSMPPKSVAHQIYHEVFPESRTP